MAVARVQALGTASGAAAATTLVITLTAATTIGNYIVVGHVAGGGSAIMSSVADSRGNTYTVHVSKPSPDEGLAADNPGSSVAIAKIDTAHAISDTVTITLAASGFAAAWATEVSGVDATTPVRATGNSNSDGATGTAIQCADTNPTAVTGDLLIGDTSYRNDPGALTMTSGTLGQSANSTSTTRYTRELYKAVTTDGTDDLTATATNAIAWTGCMVVLRAAAPTYADIILATSGLLHYWRLGDPSGSVMAAETGTAGSYTGTPTLGATGALAGDADTAVTFNGSSQAASAAANLSAVSTLTIEFWLKVSSWGGADQLAFEYTTNYNTSTGGFVVNPNDSGSGRFQVAMTGNSGGNYDAWSFARPSTGVFHHYALILDRTQAANSQIGPLYMDGVARSLQQNQTPAADITGNFVNSTLYFMSRATTSLRLAGTLDEVALYNRALTAQEVLDHYEAGAGIVAWPPDEPDAPALRVTRSPLRNR